MPFLTIQELQTAIPKDVQEQMVDDPQVEQIILEEQAKMATYLQGRYDTEVIFAAEGAARNFAVLAYLKAMVLSRIYTVNGRALNEVAEKRVNEAMQWLEDVAASKITPQLPRADTDKDGQPDKHIVFGSSQKRTFE